ncbi:MAG: hypothetical protein RBT76_11460 [candidate division Zixibacteria bacterium]|nr:hypothetical protein [candidate division Zixibacteria bacterium]
MRTFVIACLVISIILSITPTDGALANSQAIRTLEEYLDLLYSGNIESASMLWAEAIQERGARFGIEYTGIPIRHDCNSPFIRSMDRMREIALSPVSRIKTISGNQIYQLEFEKVVGQQVVKHVYYCWNIGGYYWLAYPQDFYTPTWPVVESKYFRIHVHPDKQKYLNQCVLDEADRFVGAMLDTLGMSSELKSEFAEKKIEYFYVDTDSTIEAWTGHLTKGMYDLPTNDILSSVFPHFHELTHLLLNARLHSLPLYTLPLLREGIAVRFGGRWGKNSAALIDLGVFLQREQIVPLDSILTMSGFANYAGADIAYPVSGVLSYYLLDHLGLKKYIDLYLAFSGEFDPINSMSPPDIQARFAERCGFDSWEAMMVDFNSYLDKTLAGRQVALPGAGDNSKLVMSGDDFTVTNDRDWLAFEFTIAADDSIAGTLLWGKDDRLTDRASSLFEEHFGNMLFAGFRYAVRFDRNEAGLYDYGTNQLMAKYIWGITPSESYLDESTRTIRIRFKRDIVGEVVPIENDYYRLPF